MPFRMRVSVRALIIAGVVCAASAEAQPTSSAVAVARPTLSRPALGHQNESPHGTGFEQRPVGAAFETTRSSEFTWPAPLRDPHDGNYARTGAIVGALATGVASAVIVGLFAKRDCEPGVCGSEFQRGALVGGGVGLAAGAVLGWLIGSEIARPAETVPPA